MTSAAIAPLLLETADLPDVEQHLPRIDALLAAIGTDPVPLVQAVQQAFGYVPGNVLDIVAHRTGIAAAQLFGVATFYSGFSLRPRGRCAVQVCEGTACHVRGAPRIIEGLESRLGIAAGQTTGDGEYSLDTVACFGCCSLAPVIRVGSDTHGRLDPSRAATFLPRHAGNGERP